MIWLTTGFRFGQQAFEESLNTFRIHWDTCKDTLDSALQMASDAMDYMGDVDRIIDQLELFNNKDALIDELKNGVGQELYDYVAPVLWAGGRLMN